MTAFDKSWALLKETIDMHEYPEGSGKFMSLEQMINARNADARKNMADKLPIPFSMEMERNRGQYMSEDASHTPSQEELEAEDEWMRNNLDSFKNNTMVNSKTGNYDPNDPEGWHPMGN
tara:strand:+ start:297 stop:653 length:357 start_codon:yes stop_codon:yes gene_type:complete